MFLTEIPGFKLLSKPFKGVLRISANSDTGISVVGIRGQYNERKDFLVTTTPPVDEATPVSNDALTFAHLAIGGGYTTEIVVFSGHGQAGNGTVSLYSQTGEALDLALR